MPYGLSRTTYTNWIRRALQRRIKLAPYMYTQMYTSLNTGVPLIRPLFVEFPSDVLLNNNYITWKQFMFGEAIMVTPIIDPGICDHKKCFFVVCFFILHIYVIVL